MEYLTVRETAEKWNVSPRMVQQFCTAGRIPGAQKFGKSWAIPADAEKPRDPRAARTGKAEPLGPGGRQPLPSAPRRAERFIPVIRWLRCPCKGNN